MMRFSASVQVRFSQFSQNGYEVLDWLRKNNPEMLKCVVVTTAASNPDLKQLKFGEVGAVLRKPFGIHELTAALSTCGMNLRRTSSS